MNKFSRLMRHLRTTSSVGRKAFPPEALTAIQEMIAKSEMDHHAEVRLIVEPSLPFMSVLDGVSSRERACELFSQYRIWDTEENCGILIYVDLADHQVEIVADRGVSRLIGDQEWETICRIMTDGFARGEFHQSVIAALGHLNELLEQHFPATGDNPNQVSNKPLML